LAGGEDKLEIEEVRSRVIGSESGFPSVLADSSERRKREILREEEPALTERIRPCWFTMAGLVEQN
jgi:hypothetical protein